MPARLARLAGAVPSAKLIDAAVEDCTNDEIALLARGFDRIFIDAGWRPVDALRAALSLRNALPRAKIAAVVHENSPEPHGFEWDARIEYGDDDAAVSFARAASVSGEDEIAVYRRDLRIERYQVPILRRPFLAIDTSGRSPATIGNLAGKARELFPDIRELYLVGSPTSGETGRAEELARAMAPVGIRWACAMEPTLTASSLAALSESGLSLVRARFRTGSPALLQAQGRHYGPQRSAAFAADCRRLGISVQGLFVLGQPGESEETLRETLRFALESSIDAIQLNLTAETEDINAHALRRFSRRIVRRFYFRPRLLGRHLLGVFRESEDRHAAMRDARSHLRSIWDGNAGAPA
jgi:hypothetical protein